MGAPIHLIAHPCMRMIRLITQPEGEDNSPALFLFSPVLYNFPSKQRNPTVRAELPLRLPILQDGDTASAGMAGKSDIVREPGRAVTPVERDRNPAVKAGGTTNAPSSCWRGGVYVY